MDLELKQAIIVLLKIYGGNYSKVAKVLHISRNTVATICKEMNEGNEGKPSGRDEGIKRVSDEEYQSLLKMVRGLSNRVKNLEEKHDEQIKLHNVSVKFLNNEVVPCLNSVKDVKDEFKNMLEDTTRNTRDIGYLQRDVHTIKESRKLEIAESMKKSRKRQDERDRAETESNERDVEAMREEKRKQEQGGSIDSFQQKLNELKNGKGKPLIKKTT